MKNLILLICLLFGIFSFGQNLSGRVTYLVSSNIPQDTINKVIKNSNIAEYQKKYLKKVLNNTSDVKGTLEFSNGKGLYYLPKSLQNDGKKGLLNITALTAGSKAKFYFDFKTNYFFYTSDAFDENLLVEMIKPKWEITQESKMIGKFLCYKATTIKTVRGKRIKQEVWFTPHIPFSAGPRRNFGLPGLILELRQFGVLFKAIKIELNPNEEITIEKPKGKWISNKEYKKREKAFWKSLEDND